MWNFSTPKKEKREQRKMKSCLLLCLVLVVGLSEFVEGSGLKENFYENSCPYAEEIVREITWNYVAKNVTLPPKFLRMHFHDCFVRVIHLSLAFLLYVHANFHEPMWKYI